MSEATKSVRVIENLFIPLSDGTRLAARLWLPEDAEAHPVPGILEYIPYRKRDGTRGRDEPMHGFFAAAGYAALRVDMRGSGESDGLLDDEYLAQEQDDALEVIAWMAAQPWCTGAVGMMGKSWGGFNCLQVAARRPPALKAVLSVCSTDDRFADDIHYMGGCLLNDNLWWGSIMLAYQARPPERALRPDWREEWVRRLEHMPFFPALWLEHQTRDAYWRHGSIGEDFAAVECPVFAVGGWADSYTNAVSRLLTGLSVPRLGLIGPWAHIYPQDGVPGPAIGFLQEALRWWDHWLKGIDTGIMAEPMLRAYVEDWHPAGAWADPMPGHWVAEAVWPSPRVHPRSLHLAPGRLVAHAGETSTDLAIHSPAWTGSTCGEWMGTGCRGEQPSDQRFDDGLSLVFDSEPLAEDAEILGTPLATLELASDKPVAQLCIRLCDVAPDGSSLRVSYQVLNLTHRNGSAEPAPLVPGRFETVRVKLNDCGHRFRAGHRIRIAISTAYWPLIWPAPEAATLTIRTGGSSFALPVRSRGPADDAVRFEPPARGTPAPITQVDPGRLGREVTFDLLNGVSRYRTIGEGGVFGEGVLRFDEIGVALSHDLTRDLEIGADDPLSAAYTVSQAYTMTGPDWNIRIETVAAMEATATAFQIAGRMVVQEDGAEIARREWTQSVPRVMI
ncbi:CocE/NonD family hydrolase [Methyloraptor flagellatus]|uniref:CocE/NonD family hydrolase n=1 Tax=Methyloraptor flagellatus TaxID=3162530 RepID=A0AAU7XH83_9HYPH